MSDDHLTLLGSQSSFFTNPDDARLESFPNRGTRPYTITVETKSLKYYLASYRNYPAFNEQIVNRITDDLVAAISPRWLKVEGRFSPRGGIQLTATAEHNPENRPL